MADMQCDKMLCWIVFRVPATVQKLQGVPIIAEDLGVITPDVHELREAIGAPGMVVLQFAWGSGANNTHLPHNHYENSVCYPGEETLQKRRVQA